MKMVRDCVRRLSNEWYALSCSNFLEQLHDTATVETTSVWTPQRHHKKLVVSRKSPMQMP